MDSIPRAADLPRTASRLHGDDLLAFGGLFMEYFRRRLTAMLHWGSAPQSPPRVSKAPGGAKNPCKLPVGRRVL